MPEYYKRAVFTLPTTNQRTVFDCHQVGHAMADARGNCVRCGEPVDTTPKCWDGVSPLKPEPVAPVYAELLGGPFDGEIVNAADFVAEGMVFIIPRDGIEARYSATDGDMYKGMLRLDYVAPAVDA